jgi:predicted TIM-barrel fold metal-dependent hydrolase
MEAAEPYVIVSTDSHVGPSLRKQLREYCPATYIEDFDEFVAARAQRPRASSFGGFQKPSPEMAEALARTRSCAGLQDPYARLRDMDGEGIAANIMFAGGENDEELPFHGEALCFRPEGTTELEIVGSSIYNRWLADFVSVAPTRFVGVMQLCMKDLEAARLEIEDGRNLGLTAVNLPAPRSDFPAYNERIYEPFWSLCEDLELPLCTHNAGGDPPLGRDGPAGWLIDIIEFPWLGRRALWQMIFSGVFERHPRLKFVLVEQRTAWVPETLRDLDSIYLNDLFPEVREMLPRPPSEYWRSNCFVGASFLAPFEVAMRQEIGLANIGWGSDYPHVEGTWPRSLDSLRFALAGVPPDEVRPIIGANAARIFGLDLEMLRRTAAQIGPTPAALARPLTETPSLRGYAFRTLGISS